MTTPDRASYSYASLTHVSPEERERVVQALCVHFAADHIGMESLEQRLSMAYAATTSAQLRDAVGDLPAIDDKINAGTAPVAVPVTAVPERGLALAIMGGVSRRGSWFVPQHFRILALMGGAEIDLRSAKFASGVTEIECYALMGGIEITVPPGVRVESAGGAFMGGFDASAGDANADRNAPVLRVSGFALMGGVEVKVRQPGKKMLARFHAAMHAAGLTAGGEDEL